ncbi:MAG: serine hydrolase [Candidatus Gastranaerophilales bacterium]|nr:serine hydrolase [Candidatus Gastranaerophilales bacterium]
MSYPIRKTEYYNYNAPIAHSSHVKVLKRKPKKRKKNFIALFVSLVLLSLYAYYICPYNYNHYLRPLFINRILNKDLNLNVKGYISPTLNYLYTSNFLGENIRTQSVEKSKQIADIQILNEMSSTKQKLLDLFKTHPELQPAVFVWEYSTGSGFEINSNEIYPSASIIKIPIAYELIRLVDRTSKTPFPVSLKDNRKFSEFFRTSGSGDLQKTRANVYYSLDYLANIMIANSDNSATNMILYEIGGIDNFNRAMRNLGLKHVSMGNWLPDLEGTNKITAYEISKILYNIDNPNYINPKYKNILKEYLGNTKNIHLIKEKLPPDVMVLHKTGDIGTMLGDSGIVYTNNGKKYIVTILVKRPHNAYSARTAIQDASKIIFEDIKNLP